MLFPKNVVIVEDEMMAQLLLKNILTNLGIEEIETFTNAKDTLEWLRLVKCDLLLADINLKGAMDGIQMAQKILEKHDIPIIFITAYSDNQTLDDALDISPFGYIVKPFSPSDIELQIRIGYQKFLEYKSKIDTDRVIEDSRKIMKINDMFEFSLTNNTLYKEGKAVTLSHKQNELVAVLCKNLNSIVVYNELEYMLWGEESHAPSALRTLVYAVRNLLPELQIISHSKVGYSIKSS